MITDAPGQDSFMDVVANLVGIFIILIIIIGARAQKAMVEAPDSATASTQPLELNVASASLATAGLERDILDVSQRLQRGQLEVEYRKHEREKAQLLIAKAEEAIQLRRGALDQSQQAQFDLQQELVATQQNLDALLRDQAFFNGPAAAPQVLDHLPTPMAKIVFGKEVHFRLQHDRLVPLPWDALIEMLKSDAPKNAFKLRDTSTITETVGPVGGFYMKYTLKRVEKTLSTRIGVAVQNRVELDRFVLIPATEQLGESVDDALRPDSQFHLLLKDHDPQRTAITLWTYPDSFDQFRRIKHHLYELGYLTAARPLPDGHPIGGSPDGSRSAAQ